jgi:hypothetical protein
MGRWQVLKPVLSYLHFDESGQAFPALGTFCPARFRSQYLELAGEIKSGRERAGSNTACWCPPSSRYLTCPKGGITGVAARGPKDKAA